MTEPINIGDACVYCGRSTAAGSGLFVNRISADSQWLTVSDLAVWVEGFMCPDCQEEGEIMAEEFGHVHEDSIEFQFD